MIATMIQSTIKWAWRGLMVALFGISIWVVVIWVQSYFRAQWYQSEAMYDKHWQPGAAIRGYTYEIDSGGLCFQTIRWDLPDQMTDAQLEAVTVHDAYAGHSKPGGYPKGPQFTDGYPLHVNRLGFGYLKLPPEPNSPTLTRTFTVVPFWAAVAALNLLPAAWLAVKTARRLGKRIRVGTVGT